MSYSFSIDFNLNLSMPSVTKETERKLTYNQLLTCCLYLSTKHITAENQLSLANEALEKNRKELEKTQKALEKTQQALEKSKHSHEKTRQQLKRTLSHDVPKEILSKYNKIAKKWEPLGHTDTLYYPKFNPNAFFETENPLEPLFDIDGFEDTPYSTLDK